MSATPLTDAEIEKTCLALDLCIRLAEETAPKRLHSETRMGLSRMVAEFKAARQEIARRDALPPRMVPGIIRPVYPIQESDYE